MLLQSIACFSSLQVNKKPCNSSNAMRKRWDEARDDVIKSAADQKVLRTKIGCHVAFSRIQQTPGTSPPDAPDKSMYQLPKSESMYCLRTESRASV